MKAPFLVLALLLGLLAPGYAGAPNPVLTTTHKIEQKILVDDSTCSATAIGPHALLTATHCELGSETLIVNGKPVAIKARIRDATDHTIFIVDATFDQIANVRALPPTPGEDIWLRGNPGSFTLLVRHGTVAAVQPHPVIPVLVRVIYDFNGFFGDSGAAVFDAAGQIVGVVSQVTHVPDQGAPPFKLMSGFNLTFTDNQLKEAAK